uniref:Uncharacterized protein n=1 Tax=Corvus moneduloides TaxID=1196302 RepID=A0A8C3DCC2_CORMO
MLFRWHREAQNAFIQITRFEFSSLMNSSNLHEAILFSQSEWSPVVLYYYYFFLFHPLHKFPSANYHGSCFPPAARLIAVNSSLWSLSQLVLQQVTRKKRNVWEGIKIADLFLLGEAVLERRI